MNEPELISKPSTLFYIIEGELLKIAQIADELDAKFHEGGVVHVNMNTEERAVHSKAHRLQEYADGATCALIQVKDVLLDKQ